MQTYININILSFASVKIFYAVSLVEKCIFPVTANIGLPIYFFKKLKTFKSYLKNFSKTNDAMLLP